MTVIRRAVPATPVWTDTLQWYARAVARMRQRPASDPTSWTYQAAVHGTDATPLRTAWNSCQHGGWYFLAWHRAYLHFFERIVRAAVVAEGGPADWALPYWNYENPQTRALPRAFRELTLPGGGTNPLRATARNPEVNRGGRLSVSSAAARGLPSFSSGPERGFGGSPTQAAFQANGPGLLEVDPHGVVHVIVGGNGWMRRFQTAALDPIFWLHHCNLDRIWAEWDRTNANPTAGAWLNERFTFFDETGTRRTMTPAGVIDTVAALDYSYDTLPAPPSRDGLTAAGTGARGAGADDGRGAMAAAASGPAGGSPDPELVGASASPVSLRGEEATVGVAVDAATAAAVAPATRSASGRSGSGPGRMYLRLDDITADDAPDVVYTVLLRVQRPGGGWSDEQAVGSASFFGADVEAAPSEETHPLSYVFDITEALPALVDDRGALPRRVDVVFRPVVLDPPDEDDETADDETEPDESESDGQARDAAGVAYPGRSAATMRVGRVALFAAAAE